MDIYKLLEDSKQDPASSPTLNSSARQESTGRIPFELDLISGSTRKAAARKKTREARQNKREASQRFHRNKRYDEMESVINQRDHYRAERDFYRNLLGQYLSLDHLPPRPSTPRNTCLIVSPAKRQFQIVQHERHKHLELTATTEVPKTTQETLQLQSGY